MLPPGWLTMHKRRKHKYTMATRNWISKKRMIAALPKLRRVALGSSREHFGGIV